MIAAHLLRAEYFKSEYEPDAEYVDGQIEERPAGDDDHSAWQGAILEWFAKNCAAWGVLVRPSLTIQVAPTHFRVPHVAILDRDHVREQIVTRPPLAVFEALSPEDTVMCMLRKFADYEAMGIPEIWLVDPQTRVSWRYRAGGLLRQSEFLLLDKGVSFSMNEIEALVD